MTNKNWKGRKNQIRLFAIYRLKERRIRLVNGVPIFKAKADDIFIKYKEVIGDTLEEDYKKNKPSRFSGKKIKDRLEDGFVYFAINEEHAMCKIGYSVSPSKRLKELQTSCPYILKIQKTVVGDIQMERLFHKIYKDYKITGEWFKLIGELKRFVFSER